VPVWLWIGMLAGVGGVLWVARRRARRGMSGIERDEDELRAAEEEVRDLDAFATPEDAEEQLPDWGPGTGT
jgi:hypothetical protein